MEFTKIKCNSNNNDMIIQSSSKYLFYNMLHEAVHVAYCSLGNIVTFSKHLYLLFIQTKIAIWNVFRDAWISPLTIRHSSKMWTFKAKDFNTTWTMGDLWLSARQPNPCIPAFGWTVSHRDLGQIGPSIGTNLAWRNKLLETSISVQCMNIKQCSG